MSESPLKQNKIVKLVDLVPHVRNYKQHPKEQIDNLVLSLQRFGQGRSIVVQDGPEKLVIVAGHGIVEAATALQWQELRADILPADWLPEQITGYLIADNLHAQHASDDDTMLAQLLQEQQNAGFDLASLGSDAETLRQMLETLGDEYLGESHEGAGGDEDVLPDEVETRCKLGDIWQLGKHRIACSNALDPETYTLLLQDVRPHAIITDPPYGMRLDADFSGMINKLKFAQEKGIKSGNKYNNVIGDHEDFNAAIVTSMFPDVKEQFWFGADYYSASLSDTMHSGAWLVWDKRLDESADKMFGSCFEMIWSKQKHKRDILRHKWAGVFGTEHEPQRGRQHPNQKPVRLLEDIITRYTDEGQIILDSFLGSGSTLISAQRTGRIVYGCELSPEYCDVILSRFEAETGQTAVLLDRVSEVAHA